MKEIRDAVNNGVRVINGCIRQIWKTNKQIGGDEIVAGLEAVRDLAEKVLAVDGKMPEKKKHSDWDCGDAHCIVCEDRGYNRAIDDCRIAITGALLSEEEIESIIEDSCEDNGGCGVAMLTNLITAVKSSWHAKLIFMANYIREPLNENAIDLDCMIDQIFIESQQNKGKQLEKPQ